MTETIRTPETVETPESQAEKRLQAFIPNGDTPAVEIGEGDNWLSETLRKIADDMRTLDETDPVVLNKLLQKYALWLASQPRETTPGMDDPNSLLIQGVLMYNGEVPSGITQYKTRLRSKMAYLRRRGRAALNQIKRSE